MVVDALLSVEVASPRINNQPQFFDVNFFSVGGGGSYFRIIPR